MLRKTALRAEGVRRKSPPQTTKRTINLSLMAMLPRDLAGLYTLKFEILIAPIARPPLGAERFDLRYSHRGR